VLRRIFGPNRDEVTGEWRKLHNEELNNLYSTPNYVRVIKSRKMRLAAHVAHTVEEDRRTTQGKCEGKKGNNKTGLQEVECVGVDWIDVAPDRDRRWALVNAVTKFRVP
jgi:hypothetical protein